MGNVVARVVLGIAVLLVIIAIGLVFVPPRPLRAGRTLDCGSSVFVMFPSDPYPKADPRYERSEACYAANVDRFRQAFVVGLAGGLCGVASVMFRRRALARGDL